MVRNFSINKNMSEDRGKIMNDDDLDRIIREIVSLHRQNYFENGERARSKISAVKDVIDRNMNRMKDED